MIRIDMTFKPLPPNWLGLPFSPKLTSSHGHSLPLFSTPSLLQLHAWWPREAETIGSCVAPVSLFSLPHPSALLQGLAHLAFSLEPFLVPLLTSASGGQSVLYPRASQCLHAPGLQRACRAHEWNKKTYSFT